LSHDNLGSYRNERVVHHLEERGFLAPAMPGSTMYTQIQSPEVPHVHLPAIMISLREEADGYEPKRTLDV